MPQSHDSSRRDFIKTSAVAAGALSLPRFAIGQSGGSPNGTIGIAVVGVIGAGIWMAYATRPPPAYVPGERVEGLTDALGRDLPDDLPPIRFTDVTTAAGIDADTVMPANRPRYALAPARTTESRKPTASAASSPQL